MSQPNRTAALSEEYYPLYQPEARQEWLRVFQTRCLRCESFLAGDLASTDEPDMLTFLTHALVMVVNYVMDKSPGPPAVPTEASQDFCELTGGWPCLEAEKRLRR